MSIVYARCRNPYTKELAERGVQRFREEFIVKSTSTSESRAAILAAVPSYGTVHSECTYARCVKVTMDRDAENPHIWHVVVEWATTTGNRDPREDQKQPDDRRPKWSFNFTAIPQAYFFDLDGQPFVDRAGTPFDPAPQIPIYVDEVTIQRYSAACNRTADRAFLNAVNTDVWNGAAAGEALMSDIDCQEVFEYGAYWFLYTYKVLVNPFATTPQFGVDVDGNALTKLGGWNPHYALNAGPRERRQTAESTIINPQYESVPIERNGMVDGRPHPLNAAGVPLDPGNDNYGTRLVWLKFRIVKQAAFASLSLVPPWGS